MTKKQTSQVNKLKRLHDTHSRVAGKMRADADKLAAKIADLQELYDMKCQSANTILRKQQAEYTNALKLAMAAGLPMGMALAIGAPIKPTVQPPA